MILLVLQTKLICMPEIVSKYKISCGFAIQHSMFLFSTDAALSISFVLLSFIFYLVYIFSYS